MSKTSCSKSSRNVSGKGTDTNIETEIKTMTRTKAYVDKDIYKDKYKGRGKYKDRNTYTSCNRSSSKDGGKVTKGPSSLKKASLSVSMSA